MTDRPPTFIPELEGLRGLMALWVFTFHVLYVGSLRLPVLYEGGLAVNVFMILSGFVMTRMCMLRPDPYPVFLLRRLARIYPVYLVALAFGYMASEATSVLYTRLPWKAENYDFLTVRYAHDAMHLKPLVLWHLSLLHGLLPEEILEGSSLSLLAAAWSLSPEWQFYLVAPVLVLLLRSRRWMGITIAATLGMQLLGHELTKYYTYIVPSIFPMVAAFFVTGILSALVYDALKKAPKDLIVQGAGAIVCILFMIGKFVPDKYPELAFIVWVVAMAASLRPETGVLCWVSRFLTCRPSAVFGQISYGFYLLHQPVLAYAGMLVVDWGVKDQWGFCAALFALSLPVTLVLAFASYHWLELPVMRVVKRRLQASQT